MHSISVSNGNRVPGRGVHDATCSRARAATAILLAGLAIAPLAVTPLLAQQRADSVRNLPAVITTATRAPARADELPQRVLAITRADIERTPAADAVDLLKKLVGVDVVQFPGLLGNVGLRGFRPSSGTQTRTLILLDGRPAGADNLSLLDMSSVERVEVLKGPASALYGSSAQGGVVNFITRRSTGAPSGMLSAAYGSFATSELMGRVGGVIARPGDNAVDIDLSFRRFEQGDDFRLGRGGLFRGAMGADHAYKVYPGRDPATREIPDTEGDGLVREFTTFSSLSGSARVGVALPAAMRLDIRGDRFSADDVLVPGDIYARLSDHDGNSRKDVLRHTEEITLRRDLPLDAQASGVSHSPLARVYSARDESDAYDQPGEGGYVNYVGETRTSGLQLQDAMRLRSQSLTVGVDASRTDGLSRRYQRNGSDASGSISEIGTYSPNSRATSTGVLAQAHLRSPDGRVSGVVGGRLDRVTLELLETPYRADLTPGTDRFNVFNPNVGLQVELMRGLRAHATAGRAFLNPNASALAGYSQSVSGGVATIAIGNPNLSPEHSVTVDGGLSFTLPQRGFEADVTYFNTDVRDRISSARASFAADNRPTTAGGEQIASITTSANSGTASIRGLEAEMRYDLGRAMRRPYSLTFSASATRIIRAEESTPGVVVDTSGLSAVPDLDAGVIFGRISLDQSSTTTRRIMNVADMLATASLDFDDLHRFSGRLGARYVGRRLDNDFSDPTDYADVEYAPSLVMDLMAGIRVAGRYRVEGQVTNLTDENHYEKRGYNLAGRSLRLRVIADF